MVEEPTPTMHSIDKKLGVVCNKIDNLRKEMIDHKDELVDVRKDHLRNYDDINKLRLDVITSRKEAAEIVKCQAEACSRKWVPWRVFTIALLIFISVAGTGALFYHELDKKVESHIIQVEPAIEHVLPQVNNPN